MKTGKINSGVGHSSVDGPIRRLTIKEQLVRVISMKGVNEVNHPIHGKMNVKPIQAVQMMSFDEATLIRLKKSWFVGK